MKKIIVAGTAAAFWGASALAAELTASDYQFLKMSEKEVAQTFAPKYLHTIHEVINSKTMPQSDKMRAIGAFIAASRP
jgi:hypothetical protein